MKKNLFLFSLLVFVFLVSNAEAQLNYVKLWEKNVGSFQFIANDNNMRSFAYNPATGNLLVASRTGGPNIFILNSANGDSLGKLDMTGVTGGTFAINYIRVTSAGVIYVGNLTVDGNGFKIYRYENESAVPTVAFSGSVTGRTGDSFGLSGSGTSTILYFSGSANTNIHVFTTTDGINFTLNTSIPLATAGEARGGISPISTGLNSELWVNGAGTRTTHIASSGAGIDTVDGGVIASAWHNVFYFAPNTGKKYIAVIGKNDPAEGNQLRMYDITISEKFPHSFVRPSLTNVYNTNGNATGDIHIKDNLNGTFIIYMLVTNNGIAAFKTNKLTIAQARQDLDLNLIPDRLNDTVSVRGTVISPNYQTTNNSYYIWDGTAGITTFKSGVNPVLNLGDIVDVVGKIGQFNGLTQLQPFADSSIVFIDDSAAIPAPTVLTLAQYKANPEAYEGSLVGFVGMTKVSGTWPAAGASVTLRMKEGIDTVDVRIDSDTDIDGQPEPVWPRDVIGMASQFSSGGSLSNGYQILPRYYATDFPPAGSIPVELISFSANVVSGNVVLSWKTATETNNLGFAVQRSYDGQSFFDIGFVNGSGTTTREKTYAFVDGVLGAAQKLYYRLRQIDYNGAAVYTSIIQVDITKPITFNLAQNYPNPFNPSTTINFTLPVDAKVIVKVFDILGKEVFQVVNDNLKAGNHLYPVSFRKAASGVYIYTIEANGIDGKIFKSSKKMTLMK